MKNKDKAQRVLNVALSAYGREGFADASGTQKRCRDLLWDMGCRFAPQVQKCWMDVAQEEIRAMSL